MIRRFLERFVSKLEKALLGVVLALCKKKKRKKRVTILVPVGACIHLSKD